MFSSDSRHILKSNQLAEVICQFRFPDILRISAESPAQFQELIRNEFPLFQVRQESAPPKITGTPGNLNVQSTPATNNYQFSSEDNIWRINLTDNFISLSCSHYTRWETFAKKLDKPLAAFIKTYRPAHFTRVGLRYLNFISRKNLYLESTPFSEIIAPKYLGILADEGVNESHVNSCNVDIQMQLSGGVMLKIHAGPGMVKQNGISDNEPRFIFDQDLFTGGNIPIQESTGKLQLLHSYAYPVFRDAILDPLFDAMDPEST